MAESAVHRALTAPEPKRRLFGLLPPKPEPIPLLSGHYIRFRWEQMLVWGGIVGFLGTLFGAGLYYGIAEVNWHIFYFKPAWDAGNFWPSWLGFLKAHWTVYRHAAFRDLLEPELFIMAIGTLMAKPSHWNDRCATWRLIVSPIVLVALAVVCNVAGVWLLNFGVGHVAAADLATWSLGDIILGFAIGHFILRPFWAPVGALLQGNFIDQSVARSKRWNHVPEWETYPASPPVVRERFAARYRAWVGVVRAYKSATGLQRFTARVMPWVLSFISLVIFLIIVLGGMAKYGFAHGWYVPFLHPAP